MIVTPTDLAQLFLSTIIGRPWLDTSACAMTTIDAAYSIASPTATASTTTSTSLNPVDLIHLDVGVVVLESQLIAEHMGIHIVEDDCIGTCSQAGHKRIILEYQSSQHVRDHLIILQTLANHS